MAAFRPLLALVPFLACTSPPAAQPDTSEPQVTDIGPCTEMATLYGIDHAELPVDVTSGTLLPVTQGFQGFLFVRLGLRTPRPLPDIVKVGIYMKVPGKVDASYGPVSVQTRTHAGGVETIELPYFFNDTPLAELIGQQAHIRVWTTTPGCRLMAETDVLLSAGSYMGADAAVWGEVTP